jgi:tight adherence protein C
MVLLAAAGLLLFLSGLPLFRGVRIDERVQIYLSGLRGQPSALLRAGAQGRSPLQVKILKRARRFFPNGEEEMTSRLAAAGSPLDHDAFRLQQITWGLSGVGLVCALAALTGTGAINIDPRSLPPLAVLGSLCGYFGRDWALGRSARKRRERLVEELPLAIDLLTLSVMAGESVLGAAIRVTSTLTGGIGEEFGRVVADVRAGATSVEALEGLAGRVDDPALARLVDALCTGIEKGAPLAEVLRAQADDCRDRRRRDLLELGGRREVLMLVPVVFLILPVVVLFALYPGLVSLELLVP